MIWPCWCDFGGSHGHSDVFPSGVEHEPQGLERDA
jgi:hypothetical protein